MKNILKRLTNSRKKKYKEAAFNYLNQFKREQKDRSVSERILVKALFVCDFNGFNDIRQLGAMETVLIMVGFIADGEPLKYIKVKRKWLGMTIMETETYRERIISLTKEYLKSIDFL